MQSIMAAIPLFTPSKPARSSPRTSLGTTPVSSGTSRVKKSTPGSKRRQSYPKRQAEEAAALQKGTMDDSEIHNISDSVQLEQDEVASASTPRATPRSLSSKKAADTTRPARRSGRISEILDRADIGAEEPPEPERSVRSVKPRKPEEEETEYEFDGFAGYRWAGDSIELQVKWVRDEGHDDSEEWEDAEEWERGKMTWEPERQLHEDAPEFLFEYWRSQGGRPENPTDPGLYEIFAVLKHNKNRTRLLIEWVGYERSEATWMLQKDIPKTAQDIVDDYFAGLKTKGKKK
ncbi:uncharacterized protein Triagg1_2756 [Trichoderma aggressivum f. europaeum]|uniref:Chromo domain-containing protein n=1 Tax=Trichoderma aggressivum f. europaeum TaxID=173218 RepID=A0AAE1M560_9HYPO|nr:hypothetical protein Triagg1_2756 [Trichoderma aggressivum f. europaeum]